MTEELSGLILVCLSAYLGAVVYQGNTGQLFTELSKEKGFVKWGLSLAIVYWLWKSQAAGEIIAAIAGLGLLATLFVLFSNANFKEYLNALAS